ncbi:MAG: transglycosylase SLT domain-containing protein [Spirochaetes bacterium]|nr:transglycosylase SLT domain-containing protein [Spirochaetota bacterium]
MRPAKIIICTIIVLAALVGADTQLLSWGLFNLFTDTEFSRAGLDKVEAFDPDRDILYLPGLGNKDLFESSRDLSICRNSAVRKHIYLYLTSQREYLIRAIQRSYRYRETIGEILKKNPDLPEELGLLPLLESCFDPHAVSSSSAVGLWQFLENTSQTLGLRNNHWLDERRHVEKSTEAALQHLRNMRKIFHRWDLALAAYNGGAGYVKRTMDKHRMNDFWELRKNGLLRAETSEYVPKFAALMLIYTNQRLFGIIDEIKQPKIQQTEYITLRHPVDLREVAQISGVALQKIRELNPELNSNITPPSIGEYRLRMPSDAKKTIEKSESYLYRRKITGVIEHRVKKGECLSSIARRYKKKHPISYALMA